MKDSAIALIFIGIIVWLQIGWVNNCYFLAKSLGLGRNGVVDLASVNARNWKKEWIVLPSAPLLAMLFALGLYGWVAWSAGRVLFKEPKERFASLLNLVELEETVRSDGRINQL